MSKSRVPWTDQAWNPFSWNCNIVSPGCRNCYARARAEDNQGRFSNGGAFDFPPAWREAAMDELRLIKGGQLLFVNNHSDTYHESVSPDWIQRIHKIILQRPDLIFQVLTKRPKRALEMSARLSWSDNLWLGVSVESGAFLHRMDTLRAIPAKHRFISFEPLLEPLSVDQLERAGIADINWMIVGGESGKFFRPFKYEWLEPFIQVSERHGIPLFFKQGSGRMPDMNHEYKGQVIRNYPVEFTALKTNYTKSTQESLF